MDLRGAATGSTAPAVVFSWSAFNPSHPPGFGFTVGLGGAAPFLSTGGGAICFTGPVLGEAVFWFEASCRTGAGEGKLPEADSCQRYKGGSSNIGHLEIFFSKFKTFLQEVLEFGEENIQDTSMLVLRKTHQKRNLQHMSKFLREISTYVKGSQNMVKKRRNLATFCTK